MQLYDENPGESSNNVYLGARTNLFHVKTANSVLSHASIFFADESLCGTLRNI